KPVTRPRPAARYPSKPVSLIKFIAPAVIAALVVLGIVAFKIIAPKDWGKKIDAAPALVSGQRVTYKTIAVAPEKAEESIGSPIVGVSSIVKLPEVKAELRPEPKILPPSEPVRIAPPAAPKAQPPVSRNAVTPPKLTLNGIMHIAGRPKAIINGESVVEGESISGAVVKSIRRDGVTLNYENTEIKIDLK
ncbi:MAG: hypothetical protein WC779_08470, partial [Candidatus Omnitrophota bacterium]